MSEKCIVIVPALNEEKTIAKVLEAIPKRMFNDQIIVEKLVVDDGSNDQTGLIAEAHGASVIRHESPGGGRERILEWYL